jgi:hypothetical protein
MTVCIGMLNIHQRKQVKFTMSPSKYVYIGGSSGWGLDVGLTILSQKHSVEKPWKRPRPTQGCYGSREEEMYIGRKTKCR